MKNKLMYMFLTLCIISVIINSSDYDSQEEGSLVPHLNISAMGSRMNDRFDRLASTLASFPLDPLHAAVEKDDLQAVKELIESGFDLNSTGCLMMTPLTRGTYLGSQLPIIDALIKAGAHVNDGSFMGGTPLSNAIETERIEHTRVLLDAGANPNYKSFEGSVLEMAINRNQLEIARMLITRGATVNAELLRSAIIKNNFEMVQLLVEAGANVNDADKPWSMLGMAVNKNNREMINYLQSKGAVRFWGESCSIQ